jgi:tetratricopeptide (TPR) repeat protein
MDTSIFTPRRQDLVRALSGMSAADVVLLAQQYLRVGDARGAFAVCEAARHTGIADPALALSAATACFAGGQREEALALAEGVLTAFPSNVGALNLKAHMLAALGKVGEARVLARQLITEFPDYPGALTALSQWTFPGLHYRDVLSRVHQRLEPRTYLEIGVEAGATLALSLPTTSVAGVDPVAARVTAPPRPGTKLFSLESDEFFARESKESVFDGTDVDLTFIDGMHLFEYALRDFANAERWASPAGTILLHDCLSVAEPAARRERVSQFWVGDTWKVLEALLDFRPDLRISVIAAPPSGVVVVRGLVPGSTVIADSMKEIIARYQDLDYPYTPEQWTERFVLLPADDAGIAQALGA